MPSFVYSPGIKVHVETTNSGTLDLSGDLISGSMSLRENAPHTFQFQLQNAQRKYDGRLLPMDKITVQWRRLNWMQGFTGYLNDPAIFQAWPGTLDVSATCTMKIPQFWYTDTQTMAFQTLVRSAMGDQSPDQRAVQGDQGLSRLIVDSMTQVLKWPKSRIHIGQVPNDWFRFAQKVANLVGADEAMYRAIGAGYVAAGTTPGVLYQLPAGDYGGYSLDGPRAKNASIVYATIRSMGIADDYTPTMVFMAALDESGIRNLANASVPGSMSLPHDGTGSNGLSVGIFQQQVGPGFSWGTVGQCQDVAASTRTFTKRLLQKLQHTRRLSESEYGSVIQSVQVSGDPSGSNYQFFLPYAKALVAKFNQLAKAVGGATATVNGNAVTGPAPGFRATGSQIGKVSLDLIDQNAKQPITYEEGGDNPDTTALAQVRTLDCSSLVDWVYYHATGAHLAGGGGGRSTVATIRPKCRLLSVAAASEIQGAVLFVGTGHIGVSLGNGKTHAAAHGPDGTHTIDISSISGNGFDAGGLLPGIDYSTSPTTPRAKAALQALGVKVKGYAPQLTDVNDPSISNATSTGMPGSPFAALINNLIVSGNPASGLIGEAFGGEVTLINDQPFLPWLQNVINASMRSFCSAPNGDFIAWFPDYFGAWGTAGVMNVELIELQDFQVNWSDQKIVTHQFVLGNLGATILDPGSGSIGTNSPQNDLYHLAMQTAGIASLDFPEIFGAIYGRTAPKGFTENFLKRFGARPDVQQMLNVPHGSAEFFMALYLFIQHWAGMFTASVPLTFMPELWPGMLLRIPAYGFQAYVQGVNHSFRFGDGGGFTTSVDICAPSNTGSASRADPLALLPLAHSA
jgi:hypothetical protein